MAAVTRLIYQSLVEGSSLYLDYDDTTLIATGVTLTCGAAASSVLGAIIIIGGITTSLQCTKGHAVKTHTFPVAVQLTRGADAHGNTVLLLPFSSFTAGHGLNIPGPVTVL